ncbi:MAG: hypothetical protein KDC49_08485 [Saprospiraceae bacterium]|nr:hypothetical protein [Saprospiraceae bacterium]
MESGIKENEVVVPRHWPNTLAEKEKMNKVADKILPNDFTIALFMS